MYQLGVIQLGDNMLRVIPCKSYPHIASTGNLNDTFKFGSKMKSSRHEGFTHARKLQISQGQVKT